MQLNGNLRSADLSPLSGAIFNGAVQLKCYNITPQCGRVMVRCNRLSDKFATREICVKSYKRVLQSRKNSVYIVDRRNDAAVFEKEMKMTTKIENAIATIEAHNADWKPGEPFFAVITRDTPYLESVVEKKTFQWDWRETHNDGLRVLIDRGAQRKVNDDAKGVDAAAKWAAAESIIAKIKDGTIGAPRGKKADDPYGDIREFIRDYLSRTDAVIAYAKANTDTGRVTNAVCDDVFDILSDTQRDAVLTIARNAKAQADSLSIDIPAIGNAPSATPDEETDA